MIEINLIPDVKRELLRAKMMRNAVTAMSITVGMIAVGVAVALGLILGGQIALEALHDGTIKNKARELTSIEDLDKLVTIQHQLATINKLSSERQADSRLFDVMTAVNPVAPNSIKIATLKLKPESRTITIEGSAENGYIALEIFKKTITNTTVQTTQNGQEVKQPLAENLQAGEASFGEDANGKKVLRFSFTFTYPAELFSKTSGSVVIATPNGRVDVTDSRLGVPESLFAKKPKDASNKEKN